MIFFYVPHIISSPYRIIFQRLNCIFAHWNIKVLTYSEILLRKENTFRNMITDVLNAQIINDRNEFSNRNVRCTDKIETYLHGISTCSIALNL